MSATLPRNIDSAVVIGGGLAGIAASLFLLQQGVKVTLLEARQRLGGRAGSFTVRDQAGNEVDHVDYCQHVGMGCCGNLKKLIQLLGQQDAWQTHRDLHFFGPTGEYQLLRSLPLLPAPLHLSGWLVRWPGLNLSDRISIARGMLAIGRIKLERSTPPQSALDWLHSVGQTPNAIRHFWHTIVVSALGEELDRVSQTAVAKVLQDGFLKHRDAFHLIVPQRPLGELFDTMALAKLRELGAEIRLGTSAQTVARTERNRMHVVCKECSFAADAVIIAVPWHQLSKIRLAGCGDRFATIARQASQLQSSPITGVHTWWDQAWLKLPHAAIVGRLCQWVFPKPNELGATAAGNEMHYYQIVISASRQLRTSGPQDFADQVRADLAEIFPAVGSARLLQSKVVTDPNSVFSSSPDSINFRPDVYVSDEVALAGDWTNTGWPATMESAVLSGFQAAETVLRSSRAR